MDTIRATSPRRIVADRYEPGSARGRCSVKVKRYRKMAAKANLLLNDCNTNGRQFINQPRFLFQGRSHLKLEAHIKAQSAVHEMDLRDGGRLERPTTRRLFRLPYHLLGPVVVSVDLVMLMSVSVLAGVAYQWSFIGIVPGLGRYAAIGLLAFTNLSAILAARGDYRVDNLANFSCDKPDAAAILFSLWEGSLRTTGQ